MLGIRHGGILIGDHDGDGDDHDEELQQFFLSLKSAEYVSKVLFK